MIRFESKLTLNPRDTQTMPAVQPNQINAQTVGAIYDEYFPEIYRYVLYRLSDENLAEDIASDVFIRLLEAIQVGHGPQTNLKGWLIATASHIVTDHLRKKYRHTEDEIPASLPDLQPAPALLVDQREQQHLMKQALSKLTEEQQNVLSFRFGQGYSIEETATLMNKNINAIKALQFRALAALQRELGEVEND
jgi:RNA polymerase sigma-70 factor (ECF subfamily)